MKKKFNNTSIVLAVAIHLLFLSFTNAQVGINTVTPSATLDVKARTNDSSPSVPEGIIAPKMARSTVISKDPAYSTAQIGTLVYVTDLTGTLTSKTININEIGYYYFDGLVWRKCFSSMQNNTMQQTVSNTILGYIPVKGSLRTVPATFGGTSVKEFGCKKNIDNGHYYCAYELGAGKNFYDTFKFAKQIGGYIVTITSDSEKTWLYTNLVYPTTGYDLFNSIWIGYNKVSYPGNPTQFTWITGENWTIDWTTSPMSTPEHYFLSGEPNNTLGVEGSCHIYSKAGNALRQWNDLNGSSTNLSGKDFNHVIIEFNEE